jgi:tetratricopeptide (TPR) repeat protein
MAKRNVLTRAKKQKAVQALQNGNPGEAVRLFSIVCKQDPADVQAWLELGKPMDRQATFRQSSVASGYWQSTQQCQRLHASGHAQTAMGQPAQAMHSYEKALQLQPANPDTLCNIGALYYSLGRFDDAISAWINVIRLQPEHRETLQNLAETCCQQGRYTDAIEFASRLVGIEPENSNAHFTIGKAYYRLGKLTPAKQAAHTALRYNQKNKQIFILLAQIATHEGNLDNALNYYESALVNTPTDIEALCGRAEIYFRQGDRDKAYQVTRKLLDAGNTSALILIQHSLLCKHYGECDEVIANGEQLLGTYTLFDEARVFLHFALGRVLDGMSRYEAAFQHYQQGNKLLHTSYDRDLQESITDRLIATYSRETLREAPRARNMSNRPVFIVGMPRSGTSLTEQILSSHPEVVGAGELPDLSKIAQNYIPGVLGRQEPYPQSVTALAPVDLDRCARLYLDRLERSLLPPDALRTRCRPTSSTWG